MSSGRIFSRRRYCNNWIYDKYSDFGSDIRENIMSLEELSYLTSYFCTYSFLKLCYCFFLSSLSSFISYSIINLFYHTKYLLLLIFFVTFFTLIGFSSFIFCLFPSVKIVDSGLHFLFSLFTLFSIFRITWVRIYQSHCHISHKLMV